MSIVTYNSVVLPYAQTTDFDQVPVYDDQGHTDWALTRFDIKVRCLLSAQYLSLLAPDLTLAAGGVATSNPAEIMKVIRSRLLQPRKTLSFQINGVELIPQPPNNQPGTVDARNGPQPQSCTILQITNSLFLLQWAVTAHYWENNLITAGGSELRTVPGGSTPLVRNRPGNNVIYNRWSESVEYDASMYMRRRREGRYVIRTDNVDGQTADQLRANMAVVAVPFGMLRESSSYTVSPDGLGIAYKVTDKQVFRMPPAPAYEASGEYVETSTNNSAMRWGEVTVSLRGPQGVSPKDLLEIAVAVGLQKIKAGGPILTKVSPGVSEGRFGNVTSFVVKQNMYDNRVEFRARVQLKAKRQRVDGYAFGTFPVDTPGSTFTYSPPYPTNGFVGTPGGSLLLQAAAYYDPSLQSTDAKTGQNLNAGLIPGQAGKTKES